jgi:threonine/homoserine/homoserine lactone efflux protein
MAERQREVALDLELYLAFVVATTVMILLPGPSVMLTVAHSLAFGAIRALATVSGAVLAIGVQLLVTLIGMSWLMLILADGFEVLRWAGVAYLVFLGVQQWRAPAVEPGAAARAVSGKALFAQGFLVTIANPKSLIFLAAFFPQFVDPAAPWLPQMVLLGVTFLLIGFVFTAAWGFAADRTRAWFGGRRLRLRNRIAGSLMIGAGVALAMVRRT